MAKTKLKDLEVTEVSLVDAGANQHAHVALYKRNGGKPEEQPTGQNPEQAPAKSGLHKFFSAIGKALKLDQADVDSAVADIEKADTFNDKMEERKLRRITDEIWDVCFALENSLCSIIRDEEVTDKAALINQSIDEFDVAIKGLVTSWGAGKTAQIVKTAGAVSVEHMQETVDRLGGMIEKATGKPQPPETEDPEQEGGETPPEDNGKTKTKKFIGGETDMKFNEANMTATDRMAFEELKKRYGVEDGAEGAGAGAGAAPEGVGKAAGAGVVETPGAAAEGAQGATGQQAAGEDIYKGLHPLVAAELIALRKQADAAQEEKLYNVAKKYEIIGKKPEELVPTLKALQAAGGTAYDDMIGVLDGAVAAVAILLILYLKDFVLDMPYIINKQYSYAEGYVTEQSHGGADISSERRSIFLYDKVKDDEIEITVFSRYIDKNTYLKVQYLPHTKYGAIVEIK